MLLAPSAVVSESDPGLCNPQTSTSALARLLRRMAVQRRNVGECYSLLRVSCDWDRSSLRVGLNTLLSSSLAVPGTLAGRARNPRVQVHVRCTRDNVFVRRVSCKSAIQTRKPGRKSSQALLTPSSAPTPARTMRPKCPVCLENYSSTDPSMEPVLIPTCGTRSTIIPLCLRSPVRPPVHQATSSASAASS